MILMAFPAGLVFGSVFSAVAAAVGGYAATPKHRTRYRLYRLCGFSRPKACWQVLRHRS